MNNTISYNDLQEKLLAWYDTHRRVMPWRAMPGELPNPYHVWLSEIMLQQTTVTAVKPYFEKFIDRWPHVQDLAEADQDEIMQMWAGLGYYARARNLHKCAKVIVDDFQAEFPQDHAALLKLQGIGPYTAAAIASIAFNQNYVAVDGNVERVTARLFAIKTPLPAAKPELKTLAEKVGSDNPRPSDFTQAFMELGATVCTPTSPKCDICPWQSNCKAYEMSIAAELPKRLKKKKRPVKHATVYWIENDQNKVLLRKRPNKGLLGGMMEFPNSEWRAKQDIKAEPPFKSRYQATLNEPIKHVFTHLELYLKIEKHCFTGKLPDNTYKWCNITDLKDQALPSLMVKVANQVLGTDNA